MDVFFHLGSTTAEIAGNELTTLDGDVNVQICATAPCAELLTGTQDAYHRAYVSQRARFSKQAKTDKETVVFAVAGYRTGEQAPISGLTVEDGVASLQFGGTQYRVDVSSEQFRIL